MAQPLPYERDFDFEFFQSQHPVTPLPGDKVNLELDQVAETFDQVLDRIARLQRDDLALASKSVGYDQLKDEVSLGFNPPTAWETATAYIRSDSVFADNGFYRCIVSHTSGDFEADLAVGKWELVADFTSATTEAQAAQAAAEAARDAAVAAKNGAESARDVAVGASAAAGTSADNAALSAGTATSAAATATGARDAALAAQSGAESARDAAVDAKDDAEAAAVSADASADAAASSEANAAATLAGALAKTNNLSDVDDTILAAGNLKLIERDTVAVLLADTILAYASGTGKTDVAIGQIVKAGGFRYEVVDGAASDTWLIATAGGVKLSSVDDAPPPEAFGAVGNGATDDTAALVKWLAYHDGKGLKFLNLRPKIYLADELVFPDDVIVFGNNATIKRRVNQAYPLVLVGKRSTVHELRADGNSDALGGTGGGTRMSGIVLDDDAKAYNCESFKNARHGFANRNVADQLQYAGVGFYECYGHDNGIPHPTDPPSAGTGSGDDFNLTNCSDYVVRDCRSKDPARMGITVTTFNTSTGELDPSLAGPGVIDNFKTKGAAYLAVDIEIAPGCSLLNFNNPGAEISGRGSADMTIINAKCAAVNITNATGSPAVSADRPKVINVDILNTVRSASLLVLEGGSITVEDVRVKSTATPSSNMVTLRSANSLGTVRNIDVDGANNGILVDADNISGLTGRNISNNQIRYGPAANSVILAFSQRLSVIAGVAEFVNASAAPTTGTWAAHSKAWRNRSSAQPMLWICSTAGAPGTWSAGANWA